MLGKLLVKLIHFIRSNAGYKKNAHINEKKLSFEIFDLVLTRKRNKSDFINSKHG